MAVDTAITASDPNEPFAGAYIQPSPGKQWAPTTLVDTGGVSLTGAAGTASAAVLSVQGIASGTALSTSVYLSSTASVQAGTTATSPTAGTAIATLTTPAAGTYRISGTVAIAGTTVGTAESNNMNLKAGATTLLTNIPIGVQSTTGMAGSVPFGPVVVALDGATSVTVNAVGNATTNAVYSAQLIGQRVA